MQSEKKRKLTPSKEIAYIAVMCALIIGGQFLFASVSGVEIVTLLFVCFSYVFGIRSGVILAIAFSLLRCVIYGFYPTAVILYIIYFPLLTTVFGALGHIKQSTFTRFPPLFAVAVNVALLTIAAACVLLFLLDAIKISVLDKTVIHILLWVVFALCAVMCIVFNVLLVAKYKFGKNTANALKLIMLSSAAAVCTVIFTLLDDVITPLILGSTKLSALVYFYGSFLALLPQVICTIITVCALFLPLTAILQKMR